MKKKIISFGFLKCFQQTKSYLDGTDGTGTGDWSFLFWGNQKIVLSKKLSCECENEDKFRITHECALYW